MIGDSQADNSGPSGAEASVADRAERKSSDQPLELRRTDVHITLAKLRARQLSEAEKVERARRLTAVRAGRHPDTGEHLKPGDRKTLKPGEVYELESQRILNLTRLSYSFPRALAFIDDQYQTLQAAQRRFAEIENSLRFAREALIDHPRRLINSLFDQSFQPQFPAFNPDPLRQTTNLFEQVKAFQQTIDIAPIKRIMAHGQFAVPSPYIAIQKSFDIGCDARTMLSQAEQARATCTLVAEQRVFAEYRSNLEQIGRQLRAAFESSDRFAGVLVEYRHRLTLYRLGPALARARLNELKKNFEREANPVFIWEALAIAEDYGLQQPDWALNHLAGLAHRVLEIGEENHSRQRLTEAERVGKVLGFSTGKGQTGKFALARKVMRDEELYVRVAEWVSEQQLRNPGRSPKLTSAYAEIAAEYGVDASTVGRAYRSFKELGPE